MTNVRIEKSEGKGWLLQIGSQIHALTSLEVWCLKRVLEADEVEKGVYSEIEGEINPDGMSGGL